MSELIKTCPECGEHTAVCLGSGPGYALFSCVSCDAEFTETESTDEGP